MKVKEAVKLIVLALLLTFSLTWGYFAANYTFDVLCMMYPADEVAN